MSDEKSILEQKGLVKGMVLPAKTYKVDDEKLSDLCEECGGYRMGERMMHNDWCSQCTTSTTAEKWQGRLK